MDVDAFVTVGREEGEHHAPPAALLAAAAAVALLSLVSSASSVASPQLARTPRTTADAAPIVTHAQNGRAGKGTGQGRDPIRARTRARTSTNM